MNPLHGILVASGNGSRYARSVGGSVPYPKHLEIVGGKTVLSQAVEGMIGYTPVQNICISVHPTLFDLYCDEVRQIQARTNVPLSLIGMLPIEEGEDVSGSIIREVFNHEQWSKQDLFVYAFADVIMRGPKAQLRTYIQDSLALAESGRAIEISASRIFGGTLFALAKYGYLSDSTRFFSQIPASLFDIVFWNINTKNDLLLAERELQTLRQEGTRRRKET